MSIAVGIIEFQGLAGRLPCGWKGIVRGQQAKPTKVAIGPRQFHISRSEIRILLDSGFEVALRFQDLMMVDATEGEPLEIFLISLRIYRPILPQLGLLRPLVLENGEGLNA